MNASLILPVLIGFSTVFQGGLNRAITSRGWGLGSVTLLNSVVLTGASFLLWLAVRSAPGKAPEIFRDPGAGFAGWGWWYWIPGILGLVVVAGIPFAISRLGALQTFVILIGSQIVASMAWDAAVEGRPVNAARIAGALMAFAAAALVNLKG